MVNGNLPEGWTHTTVEDLYEVVGGGTPSTSIQNYWEGDIPWITSADIVDLKNIRPRKYITENAIANSATNLVPAGSLIVVTRVSLGKVALTKKALCFSQDSQALIIKNKNVLPEYALYYLSQAVQVFKYQSRGTTISGVTKKQLKELPFPLPPLSEQERIVAKIEELFTQLDAGTASLKRVQAGLKRYKASVLKAAVEGRLFDNRSNSVYLSYRGVNGITNSQSGESKLPDGWNLETIGSIFKVTIGGTPSREKPNFWNGNIPWVSSGEVRNSRTKKTRELITSEGMQNSNAKLRPIGTVLLAMIGEGKTRGQAAILDIEATTNQNIASIWPNPEKAIPEWVFYWLQSRYEQTRKSGSGGMQYALNSERIRNFEIPIPPLAEQRQIVAEVERRLSVAQNQEAVVVAALARASRLRQAVLKAAFEGRLS